MLLHDLQSKQLIHPPKFCEPIVQLPGAGISPCVYKTDIFRHMQILPESDQMQQDLAHLSNAELRDLARLMKTNTLNSNVGRRADIVEHGYSTKFAYHVARLLAEVEQIMIEHDLDIERNREQLKSIRRGEWSLQQIKEHFAAKERALEDVYAKSTLRAVPDEPKIKQLLLDCLEYHYGDLSMVVARNTSTETILRDLQAVIDRHQHQS